MPMTEAQMRDCLLDALSEVMFTSERPAEMTITWFAMRRRTQDAAIMRGFLDGGRVAFEEAEDKVFGSALWALFGEGTLAPVFKAQRYGRKTAWEEGEFKLTSRGMRGMQAAPAPKRDAEAYVAVVRQAAAGLAGQVEVVAYADQAVRAARGELLLAAAVMAGLALEAALAELARARAGADAAPTGDLRALAAWLDAALASDPAATDLGGLGPIAAGAGALASMREAASREGGAPTAHEVDAALGLLPACLERAAALLVAPAPRPA